MKHEAIASTVAGASDAFENQSLTKRYGLVNVHKGLLHFVRQTLPNQIEAIKQRNYRFEVNIVISHF